MAQRWIPAVFMRGGTSKGLFFEEHVLPPDPQERDAFFLVAMGSPDRYGRQLNGMGGGLSSLSKAVIVAPSSRTDVDVDYTFAQVAVDEPVVDYASNCGNLASAVGPFAVDQHLLAPADGITTVRMFNTNTEKVIHAHFDVADGHARVDGDLTIPGVSGAGAPIKLDFLDPGGSRTGALLPTGAVNDHLNTGRRPIGVSLVDAANPVVFVSAHTVGLHGSETVAELEANPTVLTLLDQLRRQAAVAMGLCDHPEDAPLSNPKVAIVAPPATYTTLDGTMIAKSDYDISVRTISSGQVHRAIPVTGALCTAVARKLSGTLVAELAPDTGTALRIGSPSGVFATDADIDAGYARSASLYRTCRRLMQGSVPHHRTDRAPLT